MEQINESFFFQNTLPQRGCFFWSASQVIPSAMFRLFVPARPPLLSGLFFSAGTSPGFSILHLPGCIFDFHQAHRHVPHLKKSTSIRLQTTDTGNRFGSFNLPPNNTMISVYASIICRPMSKSHNLDYLYSR